MPEVRAGINLIEPRDYDFVITRLRQFFREKKGFVEVPVQSRLSILAACEDPRTIGDFHYAGQLWPLPQTGQMWLEHELLRNPDVPGYFCVSTSYRNEPNPIHGRHDLIFPMFEFEMPGTVSELKFLEAELLDFLGFPGGDEYFVIAYEDAAKSYGVEELTATHEERLYQDEGPVVFLHSFPEDTSPFWNMRRDGGYARKIDVILYGIETIGSAERSVNAEEMRERFATISDGVYADLLYARFGRERVQVELEEFLSHKFFERCGGGIGVTRMIRALKLLGKLK